jgi:hypothetical protein
MSKLATFLVAVGALALVFVTLNPDTADAGWRKRYWGYGGPGVSVYVGPNYGWYGPRYGYYAPRYYRPYRYSYSGYGAGYPYAYYPYWRKRYWRGWY